MSVPKKKPVIVFNIRAKARQRDLIDSAANQQGRSRSEFMLDAACREAESVLLDQAVFSLELEDLKQLRSILDESIPPGEKLRRLLKTKAPWDKK